MESEDIAAIKCPSRHGQKDEINLKALNHKQELKTTWNHQWGEDSGR